MAQVEINEMLCLVGDVAAKVPPDNAVPGGVIFLVKLLRRFEKRKLVNIKSNYKTSDNLQIQFGIFSEAS